MTVPEIVTFGPEALLLRWQDEVSEELQREVWSWEAHLNTMLSAEIAETSIGYREIALFLRPGVPPERVIQTIRESKPPDTSRTLESFNSWEIPVCYGAEFGPDLAEVAEYCGLSPEAVISRHSAKEYLVHFIGFLPGFPYLGGLDPILHTPRRSTPRPSIPAGAVGIGGRQTGIYPHSSPGGWQLIGRTPLLLFRSDSDTPVWLEAGDRLRFCPIDREEFDIIAKEVQTGDYQPKGKRHGH